MFVHGLSVPFTGGDVIKRGQFQGRVRGRSS